MSRRILRAGTAGLAALALGFGGLLGCADDDPFMELRDGLQSVECAERESYGTGRSEVERLRSAGYHADAEALGRALAAEGC